MKRMLCGLMSLICVMSAVAAAPSVAAGQSDLAESGAVNWSALYEIFIMDEQYRNMNGATYYDDHSNPIWFALHDLNNDGIPELFTNNGWDDGAAPGRYVFSIKNNKVVYVGSVGWRRAEMFFDPSSSDYHGLFCHDGNSGHYPCRYYTMKGYKIKSEEVFYVRDVSTNIERQKHVRKVTTENKKLYQTYLNCTVKVDDSYFRYYKRSLAGLTTVGILTMGWDRFIGCFEYLRAPKMTKFENTNTGVKLSWSKVAGAKKYRLFMKVGSSWKTMTTTASTSFFHKTSSSGKKYLYTIRALDSQGRNISGFNKKDSVNTFIAAPKLKSLKKTAKGPRLVFSQVKGAKRYRVFRKTAGASWKKLGDVKNTRDYIVDKTAKKGIRYTYTVRCVSSNGKKHVSGFDKSGLTIVA